MSREFLIKAKLDITPGNINAVLNNITKQLQSKPVNLNVLANTSQVKAAATSIASVGTAAKGSEKSINSLGASIGATARRIAAFSLATATFLTFVRAVKTSLKNAIEFEKEIIKIAQGTGKTVDSLSDLNKEIGKLASGFGVSSKELVVAARTLAQAGISGDKLASILKTLSQTELAATFDTIIDTTEGVIAVLAQFQKEARAAGGDTKFVEKAFESISVVAKKFAVESADLITVIQKSGGAFEAAGGSLNELLALFTSVRATTRESADSIATGFRTIFARIQRVDTIQKLRDLGIELQDVQGKFVGPLEAVRRLSEALSNLDSKDFRFSLITEELGGIRQISKIIPLVKQFAVAKKALALAEGSGGDLAKDAELAQTSLGNKIVKLREEFEVLTRKLTQGNAFKALTTGAIEFSRAIIKVVDAIEPLIPLISAGLAIKFGRGLVGSVASFAGVKRNSGGPIPGVGNKDTVHAKLTPGEYVLRKSAAQRIGKKTLDRLNRTGDIQMFAKGGKVLSKKEAAKEIREQTEKSRKAKVESANTFVPFSSVPPPEVSVESDDYRTPSSVPKDYTPKPRRSIAEDFVEEEAARARLVKRQDAEQKAKVEKLEASANIGSLQDRKIAEISKIQKDIVSAPTQAVREQLEKQLEMVQRQAIDLGVKLYPDDIKEKMKGVEGAFVPPKMEKSGSLLASRRKAAQTSTSSSVANPDISDFLTSPKAGTNYKISEKEFDKMLGVSSNVVDEQKEAAKAAKEANKIQKEAGKKAAAEARNQAKVQKQAAEATKKYDKAVNSVIFGTSKKPPKSGAQFNADFFDQFVTQPTITESATTQANINNPPIDFSGASDRSVLETFRSVIKGVRNQAGIHSPYDPRLLHIEEELQDVKAVVDSKKPLSSIPQNGFNSFREYIEARINKMNSRLKTPVSISSEDSSSSQKDIDAANIDNAAKKAEEFKARKAADEARKQTTKDKKGTKAAQPPKPPNKPPIVASGGEDDFQKEIRDEFERQGKTGVGVSTTTPKSPNLSIDDLEAKFEKDIKDALARQDARSKGGNYTQSQMRADYDELDEINKRYEAAKNPTDYSVAVQQSKTTTIRGLPQDFGGSQNIPSSDIVRQLQAIKNSEGVGGSNGVKGIAKSIKDAIKSLFSRKDTNFSKELSKSSNIAQAGQNIGFLGVAAVATAAQLGVLDQATAGAIQQATFFGSSILLIGSTLTDILNKNIQKSIEAGIQEAANTAVETGEPLKEAAVSSNNKALIKLSSILNGFTVGLAAGGAVVTYFSAQTQNAADASTKLAEAQLERIRAGGGNVDIFAQKTGEAAGLSDLSKRQQKSGLTGAAAGAATGAIIGAFAGPFGLAAGAAIGGILGGVGGGAAGVGFAGGTNETIEKANKSIGKSIGNTSTALNVLERNLDTIGRTTFNGFDQAENEIAANKAVNAEFNILRTTLIAQVAAAKEAVRIESESGLVSEETKGNLERLNKELDVANDRIKNNIDKTFLGVQTLSQKRLDSGSSLKQLLGSQEFQAQLGQLTQDLFDAGYTVEQVDAQLQNTIQSLNVDAITRAKLEILKIKEAQAIDALVQASLDAATGLKTLEISSQALSVLEQRFSNLGGTSSSKLDPKRQSSLLGPISTNINNTIGQIDNVKRVLEPALNELRKFKISDKSLNKGQFLTDTFNAAGITVDKNIFDTIISSLETAFKDGLLKSEGIDDIFGDLSKLSEKEESVREQEIELQQRYVDLSINLQNALQESIQKRLDLESGLVDIITKGQERLEDAFQKPLLFFADRQAAFKAQGAASVGNLSGDVAGLSGRARQLQTGIEFTRNLDRNQFDLAGIQSVDAAAIEMEAELIRVTSELKRLSDQSNLASAALKDIDLERSKRDAVRKTISDFTFSDNSGRREIIRSFDALGRVIKTGDLQSIPDKLRGSVGQLLDQFKDVNIVGGLTGSDIKKRLELQNADRLSRRFLGRGLRQDEAKAIIESTPKEDQLIAELKDINKKEYDAQLALLDIEKNQSQAILTQQANLVTSQQQVFATLAQQLALSQQAQTGAQQALANTGITPVIDNIKALEATIVTLNTELQGLNGNIKSYVKGIIGPTKTIERDGKQVEVPINDRGAETVNALKEAIAQIIREGEEKEKSDRMGSVLRNQAGPVRTGYATGGAVYRQYGGAMFQPKGTDTIPAMLSEGEYVVRKSAVDKIGVDALDRINTGYFASGGSIDDYLAGKLARKQANDQRKSAAAQAYRDRGSGIRNQRGVNASKYRAYLQRKAAKNAIGPQGNSNYYAGGNKLRPSFLPYSATSSTGQLYNPNIPQSNAPNTYGVSKFGTIINQKIKNTQLNNTWRKLNPKGRGLNIQSVQNFGQPNIPTILPQSGFQPYQRMTPTPVQRRQYKPINISGKAKLPPEIINPYGKEDQKLPNRVRYGARQEGLGNYINDQKLEEIRYQGAINLRKFQNPNEYRNFKKQPLRFASGGVVGGRKSGGSGVDSVVKSFSSLIDKLEGLGKIFNNMTMTHNVTVDGQLNLGGLNSKAIAEDIRDAIGKEVVSIVRNMMDQNSKTLKAT